MLVDLLDVPSEVLLSYYSSTTSSNGFSCIECKLKACAPYTESLRYFPESPRTMFGRLIGANFI